MSSKNLKREHFIIFYRMNYGKFQYFTFLFKENEDSSSHLFRVPGSRFSGQVFSLEIISFGNGVYIPNIKNGKQLNDSKYSDDSEKLILRFDFAHHPEVVEGRGWEPRLRERKVLIFRPRNESVG
ncbi:MAG: hypothetical protein Q8N71_03935 [candidate division Zixibacteria bacterium]|nr:hypothetical protein [candidate division Zixibacteria bacterium]